MKLWEGAVAALGGAALAVAAIYAVPGFAPGSASEESENAAAEEQPFGTVAADEETLKHADIQVVALAAGSVGNVRSGYARALDLSALAAINADYRAASASAAASANDYVRQKALFAADTSTSARVVEQARVQQAADAEKVKLACRRVSLEYGAGLEHLGCPALDALLRDAAAGRAALVRLDFADGPPAPGSTVTITGGNAASDVRVLGPAALADPQLQTSGALAIVRGPAASCFGVGQVFDARISTGTSGKSGVIVPRSAILRADGAMWVYRADKGGVFTRVELKDAQSAPDGWLVREGLKPGDRVAASGAGTLFGLEHGAPAEEE
ncbi:MAG: hypothetical protein U1E68_02220 [Sphingomonadaceae bacterium]|jgi:hypothetical protein